MGRVHEKRSQPFRTIRQHDPQRLVHRVIGTSHAGVEVDFLITSQYTCANKGACFVHCDRGRFTAPWKWAEMITAQQDLIIGESSVPRHGTDKTGKLLRILSRIAAELIYLAGS